MSGLAILAGTLLVSTNSVNAGKTLYVSKSSEDISGTCTAVDPCATITRALQAAGEGDRIEIPQDNYYENLTINKSVTLHGSGSGQTYVKSDDVTNSVFTILDAPGNPVSVTLENLDIREGKSSLSGAGINTSASQLRLVNVRVTNNHSTAANGGGIACTAGGLTIEKSSIENNLAYEGGGGIWIGSGCTLTMRESSVILNEAGHAGALWVEGSAQLTNATISSNRTLRPYSFERAGGIEIWDSGTVNLNHVTLAFNLIERNDVGKASQVWVKGGGQASLTNTLVHGFPELDVPLCAGELTSGGYNLSEDDSCDFTAVGDLPNTDALPVGLSDNGGYTQTNALPADSPAIDAAAPPGLVNPVTDQRGLPMSDGNFDGIERRDVGAYEYQYQAMMIWLPAIIK